MRKIALFTIESFASGEAVTQFINKYHDRLAVVITDDPFHGKRGGFFKQLRQHYHRAGIAFVWYLTCNFILYPYLLRLSSILAWFQRRPRKRFSVSELCQKYQIRYIKTPDVNRPEIVMQLKQANIDLIVSCFFDQVIKKTVIEIPAQGVFNVHPGLLPECGGAFPVIFSAKNNFQFGVTVHEIVDTSIDTGPIVARKSVDASKKTSLLEVDRMVMKTGAELVFDVIEHPDIYRKNETPQIGRSYFPYPARKDIKEVKKRGFRLVSVRELLSEMLFAIAICVSSNSI